MGIGGLGQFGVQLAKAMGNKVTAISTSPSKEAAAREIGADNFVVSTSEESMAAAGGSLDLILNTVAANHDINTYLPLLAPKGVIVQLGLALAPHSISQVRGSRNTYIVIVNPLGGPPVQEDRHSRLPDRRDEGDPGLHQLLPQAQDPPQHQACQVE